MDCWWDMNYDVTWRDHVPFQHMNPGDLKPMLPQGPTLRCPENRVNDVNDCQCIHSCHDFFSHHTWQTMINDDGIARCSTGTRSSALLILWLAKVSGHRLTGRSRDTGAIRPKKVRERAPDLQPLQQCRTRINISEDLPEDARRCGRRYVRNRYRIMYIFQDKCRNICQKLSEWMFAHIHVSLSCQSVVGVALTATIFRWAAQPPISQIVSLFSQFQQE